MVPAALKHRGVKIVAAADVVAVYIATPNQFHLVHAMAAFASSRHVLLEKPMPTTIEEPDAIIAEAERLDDRCGKARRNLAKAQAAGDELAMKAAGRYGGSALIAVFRDEAPRSFSWTADLLFVVTGDKAEVRVTPDGVIFTERMRSGASSSALTRPDGTGPCACCTTRSCTRAPHSRWTMGQGDP